MDESVTIILPLPAKVLQPNTTIATIGGRMCKASASKRYRRLTAEAVGNERVETAPWEMVRVAAKFYYATNRRRDQDNATAALKAAYDGIVDSGLVGDDDIRHMRRDSPEFAIDKDHPRVELTIVRLQ